MSQSSRDPSELSVASLQDLTRILSIERRRRRLFLPLVICVAVAGVIAGRLCEFNVLPQVVEEENPQPAPPGITREQGDRQLREGLYGAALNTYRRLGSASEALQYRIGLCEEALGQWNTSLHAYREVVSSRAESRLAAAAEVGQARVWLRMGTPAQAKPLLHKVIQSAKQPTLGQQPFLVDALYLLGIALAFEKSDAASQASAQEPSLAHASCHWDVGPALAWAQNKPDAQNPVVALSEIEPEDEEKVLHYALSEFPDHNLAETARLELANLRFLEGDLAAAIEAYRPLLRKPYSPESVPAAFNRGLAFERSGQSAEARAAFQVVVAGDPGHQLVPQALLQIGRLWIDAGKYDSAVKPLRHAVELRADREVQAAATVQLCLAYVLLGSSPDRLAVGELLLEHRKAVAETAYQNMAAALNAYVRFQSSTGANQDRASHELLGALVRVVDINVSRLGLAGVLVIGRAYHDLGLDSKMAGIYSRALIETVSPTGMIKSVSPDSPEFLNAYSKALDAQPHAAVCDEMAYRLADFLYFSGQWKASENQRQAGINQLQVLSERGNAIWSGRALFRLAEIALEENRPKDCVTHGFKYLDYLATTYPELLQDADSYDRVNVLRLMGKAYEQLEDRKMATLCFAGDLESLWKPQQEAP